jgi:hypothetical protein
MGENAFICKNEARKRRIAMRKLSLFMLLMIMLVVANGCRKSTEQNTSATTTGSTTTTTTTVLQVPRFNSAIARSGEIANSIRIIASAEDSTAVIYFVIIAENAQEPNDVQIKAGVNYDGVTILDKGSAIGEIVEDRTTGLVGETTYKVAFVLELNGMFSQVTFRTAEATSEDDLVDRGDGSSENPFWVETIADLQKVGTGTDGWANTLHYVLKNDIDLIGVDWNPIGRNEDGTFIKFNGTFDGSGHVISNVTINNKICFIDPLDATKNEKSGFFCELDLEGVIKNFHLRNVNITANEKRVGGIVGYSKGMIENVSVIGGTISATTVTDSQVGGIVGAVYELGSISKAYTDITVKGEGKRIGGIVGSIDVSDKSTENLVISDVYTIGDVIGLTASSNQVGGIVGYSRNTNIERAYASGNIYGTTDIGGIAGFMQKRSSNTLYDGQPQLKDSFYMGSQVVGKGDASGANRVGALVGNISTNNNTVAVLVNNYAIDSVILSGKVGTTAYMGTNVNFDKFIDTTWLSTHLTGWNFTNVWEIKTSAVRPVLKGMNDNGSKVEHTVDLLVYDVLANKGETVGTLIINAKSNKTGNIYYVLVLKGQTAPTAVEVKSGANYGDVTLVASGSVLNSKQINETKALLINTEYDLYVYVEAGSETTPVTKVSGISQDISTGEKLIEAKNGLEIGSAEVSSNVTLPVNGLKGSTITWSSNNTDVIANDGTITIPNSNTEVILTATITIDGESIIKTFNLTVLGKTVEVRLTEAKEGLVLTYTNVNSNIILPSSGLHESTITWISSNQSAIANDGTYTSPEVVIVITLTARVSINGQSVTKDFTITVTPLTIEEKLNEVKSALNLVAETTTDLSLVTEGLHNATITWVSSNPEVISNTGIFVRPETSVDVTLTATITIDDQSVTKVFIVNAIEIEVNLPWGGENPETLGFYPIYSVADLEAYRDGANNGTIPKNSTFKLKRNIDMSIEYGPQGKNWTPIGFTPDGSGIIKWRGTFDGQGYKINGLYIEETSLNNKDYGIGFFGTVDTGAVIKNVKFTNVFVKGLTSVGTLIGYGKPALVENVSVDGGTVISTNTGDSRVGGIIGRLAQSSTDSLVNKLWSNVSVSGSKYVGGLIGHVDYTADTTFIIFVKNVYTLGDTTGTSDWVGGVVGFLRGRMENAVSYGNVSGNKVGGVVGYVQNPAATTARPLAALDNAIALNSSIIGTTESARVVIVAGSNGEVDSLTKLFALDTLAGVDGTNVTALEIIDANWFSTNLPSFDFTNVWQILDGKVILR